MKRILIFSSIFIIFLVLIIGIISKSIIKSDTQVVKLTEANIVAKGVIRSELKTPYKIRRHVKGSFNDTIILNNRMYPPSQINIENKMDWYADSIIYNFNPYRASKVKLKLVYTFYQ